MGLGGGPSHGLMRIGHTFIQNLPALAAAFPLRASGYFGRVSDRHTNVRIIESPDPVRAAYDFQDLASRVPKSVKPIPGKGFISELQDGTIISYRRSSKSGLPTVELTIRSPGKVKSQKIHFVKSKRRLA